MVYIFFYVSILFGKKKREEAPKGFQNIFCCQMVFWNEICIFSLFYDSTVYSALNVDSPPYQKMFCQKTCEIHVFDNIAWEFEFATLFLQTMS